MDEDLVGIPRVATSVIVMPGTSSTATAVVVWMKMNAAEMCVALEEDVSTPKAHIDVTVPKDTDWIKLELA